MVRWGGRERIPVVSQVRSIDKAGIAMARRGGRKREKKRGAVRCSEVRLEGGGVLEHGVQMTHLEGS
ncbi:hypothetical protein CLOM_g20596 [Closterium sp. NIES-68]|nr:hypothetical protein CLOM_g20596 [Closterium sp. NIES-68]